MSLHPFAPAAPPSPDLLGPLLTGLMADAQQPWFIAALAVVCLLAVGGLVRSSRRVLVDPSRLFSAAQRTEGFARAGNRCELERVPFVRCHRKAEHGDHYYPHSKGGATSMGNFVAACSSHNTAKGAKVMTFWYTQRLESRRRRYFGGGDVRTGERYTQR